MQVATHSRTLDPENLEALGNWLAKALDANRPNPDAIRNQGAMDQVIGLMIQRGYIDKAPSGYKDLSFLDKAEASAKQAACC